MGCIGQLPQAQSQREMTPPSSKEASKAKGLVTMSKLLSLNVVVLHVHCWYGLAITVGWLHVIATTLQERQLKQLG